MFVTRRFSTTFIPLAAGGRVVALCTLGLGSTLHPFWVGKLVPATARKV